MWEKSFQVVSRALSRIALRIIFPILLLPYRRLRLQALGGEAGFAVLGGDVPHALALRSLRDLDKCFNVTERAFYWHRRDRASVTDTFHLLLAPEQVTFAYNTR